MNDTRAQDAGTADEEGQGEGSSGSVVPMDQAPPSPRAEIVEERTASVPLTPGPSRPPAAQEMVPIRQLSKDHLIGLLEVAQEPPATSMSLGIQVGWTNGSTTYVPSVADMHGLFELDAVQAISTHYSFPDKSALHMTLLKGAVALHSAEEGTQARHRHGAIKAYLDNVGALASARPAYPWLLLPVLLCFAMAVFTLATSANASASIWWSAAAIALELLDRALRRRKESRSDRENWLVLRYPAARSSIWASSTLWSAVAAIAAVGSLIVGILAVVLR